MPETKKEKPRHLGRGLQSLLGPITSGETDSGKAIPIVAIDSNLLIDKDLDKSFREIDINSIEANPYQPRGFWDEKELDDLADSIKANGVIQPIIVRQAGKGYQLIAGERRYRAAKLASLSTIPALVRKATDEQLLELALVENIHRADLNPIERAEAYRNYLNKFSLTQSEAAERLGENRSVIANFIRLLELPQEIRQMLIGGQLMMGHARAILSLPTDELRRKLANRALAGRLSVREVERIVQKHLTEAGSKKQTAKVKPANIVDLENELTSELGTKVNIETRKNGQRGKIVIEFYSLDDFDRITEKIGLSADKKTSEMM